MQRNSTEMREVRALSWSLSAEAGAGPDGDRRVVR